MSLVDRVRVLAEELSALRAEFDAMAEPEQLLILANVAWTMPQNYRFLARNLSGMLGAWLGPGSNLSGLPAGLAMRIDRAILLADAFKLRQSLVESGLLVAPPDAQP